MTEWATVEAEGAGSELCAPFLESLPVSGVAVSLFGASLQETTVAASDRLAARLDELQFELGEGPRWEALRTRTPVLIPWVRRADHHLWPVFAEQLLETEVKALFVFPLTLGAIDVGVIELYSTESGSLSRSEHFTALRLGDTAAWNLLRRTLMLNQPDGAEPEVEAEAEGSPLSRREIHQATGMALAQTGCTATEALLLLRGHAFSHGRTLLEIAGDVVARRLDLTPAAGTGE